MKYLLRGIFWVGMGIAALWGTLKLNFNDMSWYIPFGIAISVMLIVGVISVFKWRDLSRDVRQKK